MTSFVLKKFLETTQNIRKKALKEKRLIDNPSESELKKIVEKQPEVRKTRYGNLCAESEPTSRAERFTKNSIDCAFGKEEIEFLKECEKTLSQEKLISIDRVVGKKEEGKIVRLTLPLRFAHIAYGGGRLFLKSQKKVKNPDYEVIFFFNENFEKNKTKPFPEKDITIRVAMLPSYKVIKIVKNSSYIAEFKKGVFCAEDWTVKEKGEGIFLHTSCREDYLKMADGQYKLIRSLIVALTGNGKSTLTSKIIAKKEKEISWIIQDDGGKVLKDGSFKGYEGGGFYIKVEKLNPSDNREIYYGLHSKETFCENIKVDEKGEFDFSSLEQTPNARAIIPRNILLHASSHIEVPKIDNFFLVARSPLLPAVAKLNLEQATALMILGQSMETEAGDPTQAGKMRNVFFYDPFVVGKKASHANIFYEIFKNQPWVNFYLLNTGGIGEGEKFLDISVKTTTKILDAILRRKIKKWKKSPTGFEVPEEIKGVNSIFFHPERLYSKSEFEEKQKRLNQIRKECIEKIGEGLHPKIKNIFG